MRQSELVLFEWEVPDGGFVWREVHPIDSPKPSYWLMRPEPAWKGRAPTEREVRKAIRKRTDHPPGRVYRPLEEEPPLYLRFARLGRSDLAAEVLTFANQYGPLTGEGRVVLKDDSAPAAWGDLGAWRDMVQLMRAVLELRDAIKREGATAVRDWFRKFGSSPYLAPARRTVTYRRGGLDLRKLGVETLRDLINEQLEEVPFRLEEIQDAPRDPPLAFYARPKDLLAALWLQLAFAIQSGRIVRRCDWCDALFQPPAKAQRSSVRFCSASCKTQEYNERRAKAVRLAQRARSVDAIAATVNTPAKTVRAWIRSAKQSGAVKQKGGRKR